MMRPETLADLAYAQLPVIRNILYTVKADYEAAKTWSENGIGKSNMDAARKNILSYTSQAIWNLEMVVISLSSLDDEKYRVAPITTENRRWLYKGGKMYEATIEEMAKAEGVTVSEFLAHEKAIERWVPSIDDPNGDDPEYDAANDDRFTL